MLISLLLHLFFVIYIEVYNLNTWWSRYLFITVLLNLFSCYLLSRLFSFMRKEELIYIFLDFFLSFFISFLSLFIDHSLMLIPIVCTFISAINFLPIIMLLFLLSSFWNSLRMVSFLGLQIHLLWLGV